MKIRSDILKTYLSIHTWTGILAGLLLFIGFYAGALTVFKEPLQQWSTPPSEHMTFIPPEQADSLLNQVLSRYPEAAPNLLLTLDAGSGSPAPVSWSGHAPSHEVDVGVRLAIGRAREERRHVRARTPVGAYVGADDAEANPVCHALVSGESPRGSGRRAA